jgi:signal transduction histidine kinase
MRHDNVSNVAPAHLRAQPRAIADRLALSRELHDRIAHGIGAAAQRIELAIADTGQRQTRSLEDALRMLREVIDDVRGVASSLRSQVGDRMLSEAIDEHISLLPAWGPQVTFGYSGRQTRVPASTAEEVLFILIEAIRNARVHASAATFIHVRLVWSASELAASVSDDGPGFDSAAEARSGGIGLQSMRERATLIGAALCVESSIGCGTRVTFSVPCRGSAAT